MATLVRHTVALVFVRKNNLKCWVSDGDLMGAKLGDHTAVGRGYRRSEWSNSARTGWILLVSGTRWLWSNIDCTSYTSWLSTPYLACKLAQLTYLFRSSFLASGATPTRFRSIRAIRSSRNMTISWPKNLMRQGLLARWSSGILLRSLEVAAVRSGRLGRMELPARSSGPGTKTKCVWAVIRG